jgi:hypothetical protein
MQRNWLALAGAVTAAATFIVSAQAQEKPKVQVQIPDPGVPQAMTIEGKFVRAAYNNEGYAIIGYQVANRSIGEEYLMLDLGTTVRSPNPAYKLTRDKIELTLTDGKNVPMLTQSEYRAVNLSAIEARAKVQRDSINYFPPEAHEACRIGFFAQPNSPAMSWEEVELSSRRGCVGRLFFKVPGGIKHGQYFLNIKFDKTLIRVPFRILTEDEEKFLSKNYKAIDKQIEEAFKPKKKQ